MNWNRFAPLDVSALVLIVALTPQASASSLVTSTVGPGGAIPDGPCGDGFCDTGPVWNTVPNWWPALVSPATLPHAVDKVTAITLFGLQHTFRGDLHVYLENPAGVLFNVIVRPGAAGGSGGFGDYGNYLLGQYRIVASGGSNVQQGLADIGGGTYNQYLNFGNGMWTSSAFPIANTPLHSIAGSAGTWKLHLRDWFHWETGSITGWMLEGEIDSATGFCFGDGTGTACPCGNNGDPRHGCANSIFLSGGFLEGDGRPSVSADSMVFDAQGLTSSACVFFQGTVQTPATVIDDGIGCAGGTLIRLGTKPIVGGASTYPQPGDQAISLKGAVGAQGGTRYYQVFYRNSDATFCAPATTNRTNGVIVNWAL